MAPGRFGRQEIGPEDIVRVRGEVDRGIAGRCFRAESSQVVK